MSLEIEYLVKIERVHGEDTFRGEKGWLKMDVFTFPGTMMSAPLGVDAEPIASHGYFSVHMAHRPSKDWDRAYLLLFEAWRAGLEIKRVEIVAQRSSAIVWHVLLAKVAVAYLDLVYVQEQDGIVQYTSAGLHTNEKHVEWLFPVRGTLPKVAYHLRGLQQRLGGLQRQVVELFAGIAVQARKASNAKKK